MSEKSLVYLNLITGIGQLCIRKDSNSLKCSYAGQLSYLCIGQIKVEKVIGYIVKWQLVFFIFLAHFVTCVAFYS